MAQLIVALDTDSASQAKRWVKQLKPAVRIFKVGSQLFTSCGPEVIRWIHRQGCWVFLDLKFHDIPQTVANAVRVATRLGVFMVNIHASAGRAAMTAAAQAAVEEATRLRQPRPFVIAVTALTSLNQRDLRLVGVSRPLAAQVVALAQLARRAGLDGVVASPRELPLIRRALGRQLLVITPGIRPGGGRRDDQKRTARPRAAADADYVVVGRPITQARHPLRAARAIVRELQ